MCHFRGKWLYRFGKERGSRWRVILSGNGESHLGWQSEEVTVAIMGVRLNYCSVLWPQGVLIVKYIINSVDAYLAWHCLWFIQVYSLLEDPWLWGDSS